MDRINGLTCFIPIQMCGKDVVGIVTVDLVPVVQKVDSDIHRINLYPLDSAIIGFPNTYPLDGDLFSGQRYPPFEQLGPDRLTSHQSHYCLYNNSIPEFMRKHFMPTVKQLKQCKIFEILLLESQAYSQWQTSAISLVRFQTLIWRPGDTVHESGVSRIVQEN